MLEIKSRDDLKNVTAFLVFKGFEYPPLIYTTYDSGFIKLQYVNNNIKNIKSNSQTRKILNKILIFGRTKTYIKNLIEIIDNNDKKKWIKIV